MIGPAGQLSRALMYKGRYDVTGIIVNLVLENLFSHTLNISSENLVTTLKKSASPLKNI
jgi:hypothetical protein